MPKSKDLSSVAHNIGHHAMSGLSCLHPHLSEACRKAGVWELTLDLTRESPLPSSLPNSEPLRLASQELHRTFVAILQTLGFTLTDISAARLKFSVTPNPPDDYSYVSCNSELVTSRGKSYRHDFPAYKTIGLA